MTLGFFGVTFHLRAQEDLRQELVLRLQKNYNVLGGEYFSPALDYIQTTVIKGKIFKETRQKKCSIYAYMMETFAELSEQIIPNS